jgi:hypothetical protein
MAPKGGRVRRGPYQSDPDSFSPGQGDSSSGGASFPSPVSAKPS